MPTSKSRKKKPPKRVLALPDLEHAKTAVLNSLDVGQRPKPGAGSRYSPGEGVRRIGVSGSTGQTGADSAPPLSGAWLRILPRPPPPDA